MIMKKFNLLTMFFLFLITCIFFSVFSSISLAAPSIQGQIEQKAYKAGDTVTVQGKIPPGENLYLNLYSQERFAPKEAEGVNEKKSFKAAITENPFTMDTEIPVLYYM